MSMKQYERIKLLFMYTLKMSLIVLKLTIFQKKSENSMKIKISQQIFIEYDSIMFRYWIY